MPTYATLPVPERISRLRDELFETASQWCFERARLVTRAYRETEGYPTVLRRAKALARVFEEMPIFIRPGELLVGQRASVLGGRAVYPEYHLNGLSAETTPSEVWDYWAGNTLGEIVRGRHPSRLRRAEREMAAGFVTGTASGFGHVIIDYEKVLRRGFRDIAREAELLLDAAPEEDAKGRAFLQGVGIVARGIIRWAERYAELAETLAAAETDPARRTELLAIAGICRRVPADPARTFHEALQSFWFTHLAMHIEQFGWSISAGRFDQYMFPTYQQDIADGVLTQERRVGACAQPLGQVHGERGWGREADRIPESDVGWAGCRGT